MNAATHGLMKPIDQNRIQAAFFRPKEPEEFTMVSELRPLFLEVMRLQNSYSSKNTDAMNRRGQIIRHDIKSHFSKYFARLQKSLAPFGDDLMIEGRDGTGRKTLIPWVRICSESISPSAQNGWYVVFLFTADGSGVYLCLSHGSTQLIDGQYVARPITELSALVNWCQRLVREYVEPSNLAQITLGGKQLANAYEQSTAVGRFYAASDFPDDEDLLNDVVHFVRMLQKVYTAVNLGTEPGQLAPEAVAVLDIVSGHRRSSGQGFGLTPGERKAIEAHAMSVAANYYKSKGWNVKDVSVKRSYDLHCKKHNDELIVEVKGTTSAGYKILMTANEVRLHKSMYPQNSLLLVHSIEIIRNGGTYNINGGTIHEFTPWNIDACDIEPLTLSVSVKPFP